MVINIRGTSGTGKTYLMRRIMEALGPGEKIPIPGYDPLYNWRGKPPVYGYKYATPGQPTVVVGSYENICGGCDGIKTQDEICNRVRAEVRDGNHVLFEGLTVSHTFSRYAALAEELGDDQFYFFFLDTPLEVALQRVQQRRIDRGDRRPFNPENTRRDYRSVEIAYDKFVEDEYNVERLPSEEIYARVLDLLLTPSPSSRHVDGTEICTE